MRRLAMTDTKVAVDRWIREAGAGVAKLAEYVAAVDRQGLQGEPFRNGVGQMLASEEGGDRRPTATLWADGNRGDQVAERLISE
jgi:hypothetical protein